jgi:beta-glucanase (GH16 family)
VQKASSKAGQLHHSGTIHSLDSSDLQTDNFFSLDEGKFRFSDTETRSESTDESTGRHHRSGPTFHDEFNSFQTWNGLTGTAAEGWDVTGGPQWSNFPFKDSSGTVFAERLTAQGTFPFNNEKGYYLNPSYTPATINPFSDHNGILDIRATPTEQTIAGVDKLPYTTGMITSFHSHSQLYGYFEIKAELPSEKGFLPAFWLLPTDGSHGEIDAMEVATNDLTHLHTTVHSLSSGGTTPISTTNTTTIPDASKAFHTYGVDWEADTITWYFDGNKVFQTATPADLHKPMYMIANLAVGGVAGGWVGNPDGVSSADFKIDYIRAYSSHPIPSNTAGGDGDIGQGEKLLDHTNLNPGLPHDVGWIHL